MSNSRAVELWYNQLGRFLHPEAEDSATGPARALSRRHRHAAREGAELRLGAGKAMSVTTETGSELMADILPSKPLPSTVRIVPTTWRTTAQWLTDIVETPPIAPFVIVVYGRDPAILDSFRLSTRDQIQICGPQPTVVLRRAVMQAYDTMSRCADVARRAAHLLDECDRDPGAARQIHAMLDQLIQGSPELANWIRTFPRPKTPEYDMASLMLSASPMGRRG